MSRNKYCRDTSGDNARTRPETNPTLTHPELSCPETNTAWKHPEPSCPETNTAQTHPETNSATTRLETNTAQTHLETNSHTDTSGDIFHPDTTGDKTHKTDINTARTHPETNKHNPDRSKNKDHPSIRTILCTEHWYCQGSLLDYCAQSWMVHHSNTGYSNGSIIPAS